MQFVTMPPLTRKAAVLTVKLEGICSVKKKPLRSIDSLLVNETVISIGLFVAVWNLSRLRMMVVSWLEYAWT